MAWAPDSGSLTSLRTTGNPCLRRVSLPSGKLETIILPSEAGLTNANQAVILGFTGEDTLLFATQGPMFYSERAITGGTSGGSGVNTPRAALVEISLAGRPRVIRTYSPPVPIAAGLGTFILSPSGDRLFWGALCVVTPSPLEIRLHRYLHFVPGETMLPGGLIPRD